MIIRRLQTEVLSVEIIGSVIAWPVEVMLLLRS